jgi:hypothetical protein
MNAQRVARYRARLMLAAGSSELWSALSTRQRCRAVDDVTSFCMCRQMMLLLLVASDESWLSVGVRVRIALRLADSQPVCLGAEPHSGS